MLQSPESCRNVFLPIVVDMHFHSFSSDSDIVLTFVHKTWLLRMLVFKYLKGFLIGNVLYLASHFCCLVFNPGCQGFVTSYEGCLENNKTGGPEYLQWSDSTKGVK